MPETVRAALDGVRPSSASCSSSPPPPPPRQVYTRRHQSDHHHEQGRRRFTRRRRRRAPQAVAAHGEGGDDAQGDGWADKLRHDRHAARPRRRLITSRRRRDAERPGGLGQTFDWSLIAGRGSSGRTSWPAGSTPGMSPRRIRPPARRWWTFPLAWSAGRAKGRRPDFGLSGRGPPRLSPSLRRARERSATTPNDYSAYPDADRPLRRLSAAAMCPRP